MGYLDFNKCNQGVSVDFGFIVQRSKDSDPAHDKYKNEDPDLLSDAGSNSNAAAATRASHVDSGEDVLHGPKVDSDIAARVLVSSVSKDCLHPTSCPSIQFERLLPHGGYNDVH